MKLLLLILSLMIAGNAWGADGALSSLNGTTTIGATANGAVAQNAGTGTNLTLSGNLNLLGTVNSNILKHTHSVYAEGDSLTQLYCSQFQTLLGSQWTIINRGIGGDTTARLRSRFNSDIVLPRDAEYAAILAGVNDLTQIGDDATGIETNLQSMYDTAHNAGIKVIGITLSPWKNNTDWTSGHQIVLLAVNTWILGTATNLDYKIDIYTPLNDSGNTGALLAIYDSGDGLHWNDAGSLKVAQTIYSNTTWTANVTNAAGTINTSGTNVSLNQNLLTSDKPSFSGIRVDNNSIFVAGTYPHRVGIGTTNPTVLLDASPGALNAGSSTIVSNLVVTGTGVNGNWSHLGNMYLAGESSGAYPSFGYNISGNGSAFIYALSDFASWIKFSSGSILFNVAPSGTLGNTIAFSNALTITSSALCGVGVSDPISKMEIAGSFSAATPGTEPILTLSRRINPALEWAQVVTFGVGTYGTDPGPLTRLDINLKAAANGTTSAEQNVMTLLSSGNVGIGPTNPASKLDVTGDVRASTTIAATNGFIVPNVSNARAGNLTLVGGTKTVSNTSVTANTLVILTRKTSGGTIGTAITYTVSAATSFTVSSDNILDTSTFSYLLIENP